MTSRLEKEVLVGLVTTQFWVAFGSSILSLSAEPRGREEAQVVSRSTAQITNRK